MKAVTQFCTHDILQYCWMRYLPQKSSFPWENFWKLLVTRIEARVTNTPILRSRGRGLLCPIDDLRYRLQRHNDGNGNPLFADFPTEIYLSDHYLPRDRDLLLDFGLKALSKEDVLDLVKRDLSLARDGKSRMRSKNTTNDWHTRAAALLSLPFNDSCDAYIRRITRLRLIPLQQGSWANAVQGHIYFPTVNGVHIPRDLDLDLVDSTATENTERAHLFECLGVKDATTKAIRIEIFAMYKSPEKCGHVTPDISRDHLQFLYRTHQTANETDCSDRIEVYDRLDNLMNFPSDLDMYIPDDHPYGPRKLLGDDESYRTSIVYPIHDCYLESFPQKSSGMDMAWVEWLHSYVGIRRHLRLVTRDKSGLSPACKWISRYRPEKFLGFLKRLWPFEGKLALAADTSCAVDLRCTEVPCIGGLMVELQSTYLPLPDLQNSCRRFMVEGERFPFVKLPADGNGEGMLEQWSFLEDLWVGTKDNLYFSLEILSRLRMANPDASKMRDISRLPDLYLSIDARLQDTEDRGDENIIRSVR